MQSNDTPTAGLPDLSGTPVEIRSNREGDSVIVAVAGEIDLSTADQLEAAIRNAEKTEANRIVVDLSALSFVDSTGLAVLLQAIGRSNMNGDRLRFLPSKHANVARLFELTGTSRMFRVN